MTHIATTLGTADERCVGKRLDAARLQDGQAGTQGPLMRGLSNPSHVFFHPNRGRGTR